MPEVLSPTRPRSRSAGIRDRNHTHAVRSEREARAIKLVKYGPILWTAVIVYRAWLVVLVLGALARLVAERGILDHDTGAYLIVGWIACWLAWLMANVVFHTAWFQWWAFKWDSHSENHLALLYAPSLLHKFNACILCFGVVWSVVGIYIAMSARHGPADSLYFDCVHQAISTIFLNPLELYVLHRILIPMRDELTALVHPTTNTKCGEIELCKEVEFDRDSFAEKGWLGVCAICLDEFEQGSRVRGIDCGHHFHHSCLQDWFREASTCPLCRVDQRDVRVPPGQAADDAPDTTPDATTYRCDRS
jgi:hypothetical protein